MQAQTGVTPWWAKRNNIDAKRASVGKLLRLLSSRQLLSQEEKSILADMVGLLNAAVHGRDIDDNTAEWALRAGKGILASISNRAA